MQSYRNSLRCNVREDLAWSEAKAPADRNGRNRVEARQKDSPSLLQRGGEQCSLLTLKKFNSSLKWKQDEDLSI